MADASSVGSGNDDPSRRGDDAKAVRAVASVDNGDVVDEKEASKWGGRRAAWGCPVQSLALYRLSLGILLFLELALRYRFVRPFYSDEGTLPLRLLRPKVDDLYLAICVHCRSGSPVYQYALLTIQAVFALCLAVGYKTRLSCVVSWFLYLSLTLRNTWLNFILDRYFHYLLFYGMFLPLGKVWSIDSHLLRRARPALAQHDGDGDGTVVSIATVAIKLQILWLYLDAGYGKRSDPLGGWTYHADPLPALDTYARHTTIARYLYAILTPEGLRLLTPCVVYVELFGMPLAWIGSYLGWRRATFAAVAIVMGLHVGIALTVRNTTLLSSVACVACAVYLPPLFPSRQKGSKPPKAESCGDAPPPSSTMKRSSIRSLPTALFVIPFVCGSIWFETMSADCDQSVRHIWSTLLHNRWNVFVGAEEYVTWEIAPGRLADSSIVDVWSRTHYVDWTMPGTGAPCTSTSRPGRWRSFPYLAELDGDDGEALWGYLCQQWDEENEADVHPGKKLLRYNFFMLQADVLPNMGFSATRKRLVKSHVCADTSTNPDRNEGSAGMNDEFATAMTAGGDEAEL